MAKQEEQQTMEEYLLSQLDTPVVLKDGTMMTKPDGSPMTKAVEALEKEDCITISDELFDDQADQIYLVFAFSALATKAKELEEKKDE